MTDDSLVSAYIARQAATVGRRFESMPRSLWQPRLPGAKGHCLGVLQPLPDGNATVSCMALRADDRALVTGGSEGRLQCWSLETGALLWEGSERFNPPLSDVAISCDGLRLATASADASVRIWNAANGYCVQRCMDRHNPAHQLSWSSDSRRLVAISADDTLRIWDAQTGQPILHRKGFQDTLRCVAWSPDNRWLATGAADQTICIWDVRSGECVQHLRAHQDWVVGLAWSPDSSYLASLGNDHLLCLWDVENWRTVRQWPVHLHASFLRCVIWSPDGRWLATAARDSTIRVWDAASGQEHICYGFPDTHVWKLVWAANGAFLISSHEEDIYRVWDCRALFVTEHAVSAASPFTLSADLAELPLAMARLHRLKLYPPLSLLRDLLLLCAGKEPESDAAVLAVHPGMRRLAALRWPAAARIALVALLLRKLPLSDWRPPPGLHTNNLIPLLTTALAGESIEPSPPRTPLAVLHRALAAINERWVSVLAIVGSEAVVADPGLLLRLWCRQLPVPVLSKMQHRWLHTRLSLAGASTARDNSGADGGDLATRGTFRDLCPSQLALPKPVLMSRYWRRELLYYARDDQGRCPLQAAVLVLDVSPPCFGPVESVTRLAAHIITNSLLAAHLPAVLITTGGWDRVSNLEFPIDKLNIWTTRSREPAQVAHSLGLASTMREALINKLGLPTPIIVLSHAWFGAEETITNLPGLRGLFVQYPGQQVTPILASHCEHWESFSTREMSNLPSRLSRLLN